MVTFIKLTQPQRAHLPRLLHMEYTLREIADEIGCNRQQVRHAVDAGCPCRLTARGHIWITGDEFRSWYEDLVVARKQPLGPNEAYCLRCRKPVPLGDVTRITMPNGVEALSGQCPECHSTINRMIRRGQ